MANKLNKNDRRLLIFLAEYRLLTVSQIAALCAIGKPAARNRVAKLTAAQLAKERTPVFRKGRGRPERWVSLTEEGVSLLKASGGLLGSVASQEVRADTIRCMDHLLELNWFRIHLLHLQRIFPQLRLTFLSSESPFLQRCQDGQPFVSDRAPTADPGDEPVTFTPDGVFALKDQEKGETLLFFLEVDMGTETLASSHRGVRDIRKKIVNYQQYFRSGGYKRYQELWDCELNGFRLLFLANTPSRLTALCRLVQEMPPSDFVWLTVRDRMFAKGVSADIWARGGKLDAPLESIVGRAMSREAPPPDRHRQEPAQHGSHTLEASDRLCPPG